MTRCLHGLEGIISFGGRWQVPRQARQKKRAIPTTPMIDADPVAEDDMRRWQDLWKAVVAPLTDKYMKMQQEKYLNTSAMFSLETVFRSEAEFSQYLQFVARLLLAVSENFKGENGDCAKSRYARFLKPGRRTGAQEI